MRILFIIGLLSSVVFAKDCLIVTSSKINKQVNLGGSSWNVRTTAIVSGKDYKYTSFADAYSDADKEIKAYIKENICKKNGWNGVLNYELKWQVTEKTYNFVATYDYFEYK